MRPASPTDSSTTTSPRRRRSSTRCSSRRWDVMLAAIAEAEASDQTPREKLHAIASFIVDSYRHDPDLMKVIIVEVTRAANTFGRTHLDKILQAYEGIARIVKQAQDGGHLPPRGRRAVRRPGVLRSDRAGAHAVDLQRPAGHHGGVRTRQERDRRDDLRRPRCLAEPRAETPIWLNPIDEGESLGQTPDVVRPARRCWCTFEPRRHACRGDDLEASLRRRSA